MRWGSAYPIVRAKAIKHIQADKYDHQNDYIYHGRLRKNGEINLRADLKKLRDYWKFVRRELTGPVAVVKIV